MEKILKEHKADTMLIVVLGHIETDNKIAHLGNLIDVVMQQTGIFQSFEFRGKAVDYSSSFPSWILKQVAKNLSEEGFA